MFKKIFQSLSKSPAAKQPAAQPQPPVRSSSSAAQDRVVPRAPVPTVPVPVPIQAAASVTPVTAGPSPDDLCEITPKMPKDQIQARLKLLYRRYNRSASSLDAKIRDEAEIMLDAIVKVREKHFGEI